MGSWLQARSHSAALPLAVSAVQASPSSQSAGQDAGGSQVSPASTTPLPQTTGQSPSSRLLQPAGQQPSPPLQSTMGSWLQARVHSAALPLAVSAVQASPSSQPAGQDSGGSQVSPASITPLPHSSSGSTVTVKLRLTSWAPSLTRSVMVAAPCSPQ